jgi:phosphatidylcholine synthase
MQYLHKIGAWIVHLFTASGAVLGVYAIHAAYQQQYLPMFWLIGVAIIVDALDGTLARWIKVKSQLPLFDGALLDNIVDYLNYVIVPAIFLLTGPLLPADYRALGAVVIVLTSAYQFCQAEAKTSDHFFKGFPSYWNIVVFYLYFWQIKPPINLLIILSLAALIFVPIKYVYPSRLEFFAEKKILRLGMLTATLLWGAATFGLLFIYPKTNSIMVCISMGYLLLYTGVSLVKTYTLPIKKCASRLLN